MDIMNMGARALSRAIEDGDLGVAELMQATLGRIDKVNGKVNAIVSLRDGDDLMAEARAVQDAPRKGWLHGIPIAIKDLADAKGLPTSMGSPLFAGQIADHDDIFVRRIRKAGAIVIGKTNTPEFGLGSHTFNPVHGATANPYDPSRSAGGSSGGAAAALAARMLSVADGSDMMGSLRNPAGWNNVYGMRPSWGRVPSEPEGDMFLHQLSTMGPMARSPEDLAELLDTMSGYEPRLPLSARSEATVPHLEGDVKGLRLGWLGDWGGAFPYAPGIDAHSRAALRSFEEIGCEVFDAPPPFEAEAIWNSWITLRSFAVAAGLSALYDVPERRKALKPAAQWEVERGRTLTGPQIQRASEQRSDWFRRAHDLFTTCDVVVLPSAQVWPFDVNDVHPTEVAGRKMDTYHRWMQVVTPASLIGLPVVNVPAGFGDNGLPLGLQLIGARGTDARLLRLAARYHEATDWPNRRPPTL
ncbi:MULTISPECIES: amidase [unclassified Sulfitobacter]|uniref:amidase n=1 Tax=unclassified Sulfitobacter TaxID=196795 RepID=UPI0007C37889|nr:MULTISPECIES: amidase [unclassified Sulfitobacter]KZY02997.1 amidase [Sulfitobacter sp. HI0023]KZY25536.1 amidase [Sulfitobacter sp. HI0040]KZZ63585.1 amidase [Sulfitobacter sp. HI0129]